MMMRKDLLRPVGGWSQFLLGSSPVGKSSLAGRAGKLWEGREDYLSPG